MTEVPERVREAYRELPPGWKLEKLKFFADIQNSNVDKTIAEDEEPVRLCNYTDVYYNERITPALHFMLGSATEAEIERFQLKRGQVIITKDSEGWDDIGIPALVTEDMPEVLCGYHLSVFEPTLELDGGFLAWLCRAEPLNDQFKLAANGVTRFGLGKYPMKNAFIVLPPLDTQRRIVRFLDEKTAQIDELIAKKRELQRRLAEKRQALITRVVTKGLYPQPLMKPSGNDWLGDIPARWEVLRLKFIASDPLSYGANAAAEFDEPRWPRFVPESPMLMNSVNCVMRLSVRCRRRSPKGSSYSQMTFSGGGGGGGREVVPTVGKSFIYRVSWGVACYAGYLIRIRVKKRHDARYVYWFLNSASYWEWVRSTFIQSTIQNINAEKYANLQIPTPPGSAQIEIVDFIEKACAEIDRQQDLISKSIERLDEYRSAMVAAAVSGQLPELR